MRGAGRVLATAIAVAVLATSAVVMVSVSLAGCGILSLDCDDLQERFAETDLDALKAKDTSKQLKDLAAWMVSEAPDFDDEEVGNAVRTVGEVLQEWIAIWEGRAAGPPNSTRLEPAVTLLLERCEEGTYLADLFINLRGGCSPDRMAAC